MDLEAQKDTEAKAPSVIDRYYTRWYRPGKLHRSEISATLSA